MPFPYPKTSIARRECESRQISHGRETALLCTEPGKRVKCNLVDEIIGLWAPSDAAIRAIEQCKRDSGGHRTLPFPYPQTSPAKDVTI